MYIGRSGLFAGATLIGSVNFVRGISMINKYRCFDGEKNVWHYREEDIDEEFFRISEHSNKAKASKRLEGIIRKIRYLIARL